MRDMAGDNVVIVGFMGAGKSVCGRLLARRLGRCFVETDDMIVSRDGRSIPDIFRQDGEDAFRRLEGEALAALALKSGDVIATGGGLPCRSEEHTSELQSRLHLVCRLLLEKKKQGECGRVDSAVRRSRSG